MLIDAFFVDAKLGLFIVADGLHGAADEAAITAAMAADEVAEAAQRLIDTALEASGSDNMTAILLSTRDEKQAWTSRWAGHSATPLAGAHNRRHNRIGRSCLDTLNC